MRLWSYPEFEGHDYAANNQGERRKEKHGLELKECLRALLCIGHIADEKERLAETEQSTRLDELPYE